MDFIHRSAAIWFYHVALHSMLKGVLNANSYFVYFVLFSLCSIASSASPYASSSYLHCAQLLLRPRCMYLRIICTVLNCFFGLTVCIFVLFALCSTASSASPYVSSYYFNCAQLLLRPQRVPYRKTGLWFTHTLVRFTHIIPETQWHLFWKRRDILDTVVCVFSEPKWTRQWI
jgi:hypothetical protein